MGSSCCRKSSECDRRCGPDGNRLWGRRTQAPRRRTRCCCFPRQAGGLQCTQETGAAADAGEPRQVSGIYRWISGWAAGLLRNQPRVFFVLLVAGVMPIATLGTENSTDDDRAIAQSLAEMLQDARTSISNEQDLINDPQLGDKHLTGEVVLDRAIELYSRATGVDPRKIDPKSREGRLLRAMMEAIVQVVDGNQGTINTKGTAFKGFIPAVFGRLVAEEFG